MQTSPQIARLFLVSLFHLFDNWTTLASAVCTDKISLSQIYQEKNCENINTMQEILHVLTDPYNFNISKIKNK